MKHAVAMFFSLLLILGDGVFSRPVSASVASPREHACGMAEKTGCVQCACCVAPAGNSSTPVRESSPAPAGSERLQIPASALTVLYELPSDGSHSSARAQSANLIPQPVPLFLRHCLLLI